MSLLTKIRREIEFQIHVSLKMAKFTLGMWALRQTMGYVPFDFSGKKWTLSKRISVIAAVYARRLSSELRSLQQSSLAARDFLLRCMHILKTARSRPKNTPED